ncbi:MAG: hypothetical protein AAF628_34555 [Planctomycetota bacterium]
MRLVTPLTVLTGIVLAPLPVAQLSWLVTGHSPDSRLRHEMVYDGGRNRIVVFGGRADPGRVGYRTDLGDTWEWDGQAWQLRATVGPLGREDFGMAYDAARGRTVLFGGETRLVFPWFLGDTWEWNGQAWEERTPAVQPVARRKHAMAYDAKRGRTILFGGNDPLVGVLDDTWEWDGTTWTERFPALRPEPRQHHAMAYDAARERVVLFGGKSRVPGFASSTTATTWEWDGSDWEFRAATGPPPSESSALAYDEARQCVVLVGDQGAWEWDGSEWRMIPWPATRTRRHPAAAFHPDNGVVVFAGFEHRSYYLASPSNPWTWAWDGTDWTLVDPAVPGEVGAAAAFDRRRGRGVLFGSGAGREHTWEWDGVRWVRIDPPLRPPGRSGHALAYHGGSRRAVLFGGTAPGGGSLGDTWEWDGRDWVERTLTGAPGPRTAVAMAYDETRDRVVLFGGAGDVLGPALDETWEWDGSQWSQRAPAARPPARFGHAMAYDAFRHRVVLFGGDRSTTAGDELDDTWEWDGTTWTESAPASRPQARTRHVLGYHAWRERIVLHGGTRGRGTSSLGDAWEWDGRDWSPLPAGPGAPTAHDHSMLFDAARGFFVLVTANAAPSGAPGYFVFGSGSSTWPHRLGSLTPAATVESGAGCPGSGGVPWLGAYGRPVVGGERFTLDVGSARPAALAATLLGAGEAAIPLGGGCTLLIDVAQPFATVLGTTSAVGYTAIRLPIPSRFGLVGAGLIGQAVIVDPLGSLGGLAFTNRLSMTLGY